MKDSMVHKSAAKGAVRRSFMPIVPVAQNLQPILQPTWLDTHTVARVSPCRASAPYRPCSRRRLSVKTKRTRRRSGDAPQNAARPRLTPQCAPRVRDCVCGCAGVCVCISACVHSQAHLAGEWHEVVAVRHGARWLTIAYP